MEYYRMNQKIKQMIYPEAKLYALWHGLCVSKKWTTDKRLRGIFSGRLTTACGPDYQGAEFDLDGRRYRGDVEIHLKAKDWYAHGHHLDWRYDNVSLHLTAESARTDTIITNSKGRAIPGLSFAQFPVLPGSITPEYSCRSPKTRSSAMVTAMQSFAKCRLVERVNIFARTIAGDGFDQAVYRLIFRMLGRGQNADLYDRLAIMLPWSDLQHIKHRYHPDNQFWENVLLSSAGFKSRTAHSRMTAIPGVTDQPPIPQKIWQTARLRPPAHPVRRLKGMAKFIGRFPASGLFEHLLQTTMQRRSFEKMLHNYRSLFIAARDDDMPSFWGENLMIEFCGNIIIPALVYYAEMSESHGFKAYLDDFYRWLPAPPLYGVLQGYGSWPEFSRLPEKFYIRQALLWLSQNYCQQLLCRHCPLQRQPERV